MAFPSFTRPYLIEGYSYSPSYAVKTTVFNTKNTRRRKTHINNDVVFSVQLMLSDSELATFEDYVRDDINYGSSDFTGPYYTSDVEYTGTLHIINGEYSAELVPPNSWRVSYNMLLRERDMSEEENIYDTVIGLGTFQNAEDVLSALAIMVNENTL